MMNRMLTALAALPLTALLPAAAPVPVPDQAQQRATITALVGFGTRATTSTTTDAKRGIGAARRWAAARFARISADCSNCLSIETIGDQFSGPRAPAGVRVEDVVAVQRGSSDPGRVIIIMAHIDSRNSDALDGAGDAPGANDDGSGVALVIEAARLLSKQKFPATIVYSLNSGEEQGLWGGQLLAATAKARGWQVAAVLNNDIVGNTHGIGGEHIDNRVRVFSEGIRAAANADAVKAQRVNGGEDDSPSRSLAKTIRHVALTNPRLGLEIMAVRRSDRFLRGGDHTPFLEAGYPAVRFTEATENYDRQHQNIRTEAGRQYGDTLDFIDFPYLAKVTAVNVAVARELASAPAAPADVTIAGAVSDDTHVAWAPVVGAAGYRVRWRRADSFDWTDQRDVPANASAADLPRINIDDHFFGVSALSAGGAESLVSFAGPAPRKP